jgi:hypothetical protein
MLGLALRTAMAARDEDNHAVPYGPYTEGETALRDIMNEYLPWSTTQSLLAPRERETSAFPGAEVMVPEWFHELERQGSLGITGSTAASRFLNLLNHIHRMESRVNTRQNTQDEDNKPPAPEQVAEGQEQEQGNIQGPEATSHRPRRNDG